MYLFQAEQMPYLCNMKITTTIDYTPTPKELARMFWDMSSGEQAEFFDSLFNIAGFFPLANQATWIGQELTASGRKAVLLLAEVPAEPE